MSSYYESLTANQRTPFGEAGRFFRLTSTSGPVNIKFYYNGKEIAAMDNAEAGYAEHFEGAGFDRVDITSLSTQTIRFEIRYSSQVKLDRSVGSVDVLSLPSLPDFAVPPQVAGIISAVAVSGITNPLPAFDASGISGYGYYGAFGGATTIVAAAANTNGMTVYGAGLRVDGSGGDEIALIAGPSVPGGTYDPGRLAYETSGGKTMERVAFPLYLPPGIGLYVFTFTPTSNVGIIARYKLH